MRVRFFNTYEPVTSFYRDLLPYLEEQGIASEVLISSAEYRHGGRGDLCELFSGSSIRLQYLPALGIKPTGQRHKALVMMSYVLGSMWKTIFGEAADVNFFLTQPPLFNLWGWVLKVLRGQPYISLMMDLYPDVALKSGLLAPGSLLAQAFTCISRFATRHSDAVIVIGRCMAERVEAMGVDPEKIHLIQNWANTEVVYPIPPSENRLRRELSLNGKFVVLYSGNMGVSHDFDDFLNVIHHCQDEPKLHFVFIGEGPRLNEIVNYLAKHHLENVTLLPFQPMERLAESLSLGDVHFVSLRQGFEGLVVPSKVYGALAAGRAVIYQGDAFGEIARMIQEEGVGTIISPNDPGQLERVIRNYLLSNDLARQQGLVARKLCEEKYSPDNMIQRYHQLIRNIANA